MFKQLKKRLLTLNMILISSLILLAFSSIYFLTVNRMNEDIHKTLMKISELDPNLNPENKPPDNIKPPPNTMPERMVTFSFVTDSQNRITSTQSSFDAEVLFFEKALQQTLLKDANEDRLIYDETHWAFMIQQKDQNLLYFYVDITPQIDLINKMIYAFIGVSIAVLGVTFILSSYLTRESIKPIQQAFGKQVQFISDASHEIKTPLTVIKTNVDVLLNEHKNSPSEKWLQYIHSEVSRMTKLTEDLLYLSTMDDSRDHEDFQDVNFSQLCENIAIGLDAVAYEKNISFDYDVKENLFISGKQESLSQVIMILLDNAFKYNKPNGFVLMTLESDHQKILLKVKNSGPYIPEEACNNVFDRFYKVDYDRQNGHGLGLSIAKAIVNKHNGRIYCESHLTDGNSFTVKFQKNKNVGL